MLQYFRDHYWLNLNVSNALQCGATPGDVARACAPIMRRLQAGDPIAHPLSEFRLLPAANADWVEGWRSVGLQLAERARKSLALGHLVTCGEKALRAAAHLMVAEWFVSFAAAEKSQLFTAMREMFRIGISHRDPAAEFVQFECEGSSVDALFVPGCGPRTLKPVLVHFNGSHSSMEWPYLIGLVGALARRGLSSLLFDHPGSGSARLMSRLPVHARAEVWFAAAAAYLQARNDVDIDRVGVVGGSMGGYHAPRAASMDGRVRACICWGAFFRARWNALFAVNADEPSLTQLGELAYPDLAYMFGARSPLELYRAFLSMDLSPVIERLRCPLLVVHGRDDRQVPVGDAIETAARAVQSSNVQLMIGEESTGGNQHCNLDSFAPARDRMADWASSVLTGR